MSAATSPCSTCHEACCRDYLVTVSGLDVYRICIGIGLSPGQFARPTAFGDPPSGFRVDTSDRRYRLSLDKQSAGGAAGWCVFWMPFESGLGRCGIYALRPGVCRSYPATMVDGEVALRPNIMCPEGAWGPTSGLFTQRWRAQVERQYAELEIDARVNLLWNEAASLTEDAAEGYQRYLDWMLAVYGGLAARVGVGPDALAPSRDVLDELARVLDRTPLPTRCRPFGSTRRDTVSDDTAAR